jgi:hypothetical protein
MRRALVFAALACAATGAMADAWPQEPQSALGVQLGARLADLDLPPCGDPKHKDWGTKVCVFSSTYADGRQVHELRSLPDLPFQYEAFILEHDGLVAGVALTAAASDWPKLRATLIERYGPPMQAHTASAANLGGAVLDSERLTWTGERAGVVAAERGHDMRTSSVHIDDLATLARIRAQMQQRTKESAGKL